MNEVYDYESEILDIFESTTLRVDAPAVLVDQDELENDIDIDDTETTTTTMSSPVTTRVPKEDLTTSDDPNVSSESCCLI